MVLHTIVCVEAEIANQQQCFAAVAESRRDAFYKLIRQRVQVELKQARGGGDRRDHDGARGAGDGGGCGGGIVAAVRGLKIAPLSTPSAGSWSQKSVNRCA